MLDSPSLEVVRSQLDTLLLEVESIPNENEFRELLHRAVSLHITFLQMQGAAMSRNTPYYSWAYSQFNGFDRI